MRDVRHDKAMIEYYRKNPDYVLALLNSVLEDGDDKAISKVLQRLAKAFGGEEAIADKAHVDPNQFHHILPPEGLHTVGQFSSILKAMGWHLTVQPHPHPM